MKKNILSSITIILGALCLIIALIFERNIFLEYQAASGKTKALFSLNELGQLEGRFFLVLGGIVGLILTVIGIVRKESRSRTFIAFTLSILVISISIVRIWRWFV